MLNRRWCVVFHWRIYASLHWYASLGLSGLPNFHLNCEAVSIDWWVQGTPLTESIDEYCILSLHNGIVGGLFCPYPGPRFNIKMSSYQYRKSHYGDKTVVRSSYLHSGISYSGKMTSLYRIRAQTAIQWALTHWGHQITIADKFPSTNLYCDDNFHIWSVFLGFQITINQY